MHLGSETTKEAITLLYHFRPINGTPSWAGLRAAKDSAATWKFLLADGSDIVKIGVLVDDQDAVKSVVHGPITGKDGRQMNVLFLAAPGLVLNGPGGNGNPIPPTYEVRTLYKEWIMALISGLVGMPRSCGAIHVLFKPCSHQNGGVETDYSPRN